MALTFGGLGGVPGAVSRSSVEEQVPGSSAAPAAFAFMSGKADLSGMCGAKLSSTVKETAD